MKRVKYAGQFEIRKQVIARYAGPSDADELNNMFREHCKKTAKTLGYRPRVTKRQKDWLRRQLVTGKRAERVTLVAVVDGVIQGWITAERPSEAQAGYAPWWVRVLSVEAKYRRCGIGEYLLRRVLSELRRLFGARKVGLQTRAHNERAKRLYRRLGFVKIASVRHKIKYTGKMGTWHVMVKKF